MKRIFLIILAAVLMGASLTGCDSVKSVSLKSTQIIYPSDKKIYPLKCNNRLTVFAPSYENIENKPLGKAWQNKTGVNVKFVQQNDSATNILDNSLSIDSLPDIMITDLYGEYGKINKYAESGIIVPLNEYMEEYAPNLTKYLKEHPDVDKMVKSDDGKYYCFPFIRGDEKLAKANNGIVVRKDILDKLGLPVPETIDEWHTALKAFKDYGASSPLSYDLLYWEKFNGVFIGAYGTKAGFYLKDGEVKYGYLEPEFKWALANLNQWYNEGLIDKNIVKVSDIDAKIMNSETVVSCMWVGSGIGKYLNAVKNKELDFDLAAAPYPVINKGDTSKFGSDVFLYDTTNNAFITANCKNIELAMRFLDFGYSEEGRMLFNFGIENESYQMINDNPVYKEIILNNKDGLSVSDAMKNYILANTSGPFIQDARYIEQYYKFEQQKNAVEIWSNENCIQSKIPMVSFTGEEGKALSEIVSAADSYASNMIYKFVMGIEPLSNYDEFTDKLKSFGIEQAIDIYNNAVKRYNSR